MIHVVTSWSADSSRQHRTAVGTAGRNPVKQCQPGPRCEVTGTLSAVEGVGCPAPGMSNYFVLRCVCELRGPLDLSRGVPGAVRVVAESGAGFRERKAKGQHLLRSAKVMGASLVIKLYKSL